MPGLYGWSVLSNGKRPNIVLKSSPKKLILATGRKSEEITFPEEKYRIRIEY